MKKHQTINATIEAGNFTMEIPVSSGTHTVDVLSELAWDGTPDDSRVLERHPGLEAWWNAMQTDHESMEAHWKETVYDAYMAHLRRFAIYFLQGQGVRRDKMTQRDIEDARLRLYSKHLSESQRETLTSTSFYGFMLERLETPATVKECQARTPERYEAYWRSFREDMFAYQPLGDEVWIEDMIEARIDLERDSKLVAAVAGAFRNRGFLLRQAAENEKARRNAIGSSLGLEELVEKLLPLMKKKTTSDPMATVFYGAPEGETK